jgi:hypothetical protein
MCGSVTAEAASAASGRPGRLGGLLPEAGIGEEAGSALGVVDHRDFKEPLGLDHVAEQLPGEVGEVGDVADDGLGDAPARVADDDRFAEAEPEGDREVNPVVEAGDDDQLGCGRAERPGGVGSGELLGALEQGDHLRHGWEPLS